MTTTAKYEFTGVTKQVFGVILKLIRASRDFAHIKKGDVGGWIEKECNLSHDGNAWVSGNAQVYGNAWVSGNAQVYGNAWVSGNAQVSNPADIFWISKVGSENGTLTVFKTINGDVWCTRGCFGGSLTDFETAVNAKHGDNEFGKKYRILIQYIRLHFNV